MAASGNGFDDGATPDEAAAAGSQPSQAPPPHAEPGLPPNSDMSWEVLSSAHAQARQRAEAGDLTGARTLLEEALATGELHHGRDHPQLAPLMVDLATIARNVGNLTEAQNQLRRAYGIVVSAAGPEHATSLSIEGRLAAVNYRLGEPTEAYDWHIADVGARVLGAEHAAVRGAQQRLAATPVHEEQTPPVEAPAWPASAAEPYADYAGMDSYAPEHYDQGGGWAPASSYSHPASYPAVDPPYAQAGYAPSPSDPGVFIRQSPTLPPREYAPAEAWPGAAEAWPGPPGAPGGAWPGAPVEPIAGPRVRGHGGGVALVASFGLAIIAAAGVIAYQVFGPAPSRAASPPTSAPTSVVATTSPSAPPSPSAPTTTGPYAGTGLPPGQLTLKDQGTAVTLTWLDPSGGQVPFIVEGGRSDAAASPIVTVPAGRTTQTIYGLNPRFDYCFTVAAVWSTDLIQASPQTCTKRALSTAST
jgi:hypothetical protein